MAPPELVLSPSPRTTRSQSISSDRPSLTGYGGLLSPPSATSPDPAFIAASAASQIVTNDHDSQADAWFDQHGIEPSGETALVAAPALKLVNRFLDQLLFNFLSISKSTSLASLRPAISEVLKPKLATDAISGADQELHEYLGGGEDEELLAFHNGLEPSGDWDLELVWKRTRLRCMVYSSLGDMEEEDEDFYTEQEQLDGPPGATNRFSNNSGIVSPAVAIFLTSILEFVGEQVLIVAGQAAYHRLRSKHEKEERDGTSTPAEIAERVVVEEFDMERVALDRTLGRLWRGWKKRVRGPTSSISMTRSFSRESLNLQPQTSRAASSASDDQLVEEMRRPSLAAVLAEFEYAAGIPLPISKDDVREIEIPGVAHQSDDEGEETSDEDEGIKPKPRPKSMMISKHTLPEPPTPTGSQPQTPTFPSPGSRKRSNSLPSPVPTPYTSPFKRQRYTGKGLADEAVSPVEDGSQGAEVEAGPILIADNVSRSGADGESRAEPQEHKGMIAGVVAGVAALASLAVEGTVAAVNGKALQTTAKDIVGDAEEDFSEEPQILTSSRVSIGGRISPDDGKGLSRRSSLQAPSVRSLRLIEVASPKVPGRSREGSVDAADYVGGGRPAALSRPSSIHSPSDSHTPRVASPILRGPSPLTRNGSLLNNRHARNSAGESISEVEEKEVNKGNVAPTTAVPAEFAAATQGVNIEPGRREQFAFDGKSGDRSQQRSAFVLAAAPAPQNSRDAAITQASAPVALSHSDVGAGSKAAAVENGAPPLTPLREMMEGAPDTSDEGSSIAPSYDTQSMSERGLNGHSPSVSASTIAYTQRPGEQQRAVRTQPANVIRSSLPRTSREEAMRKPETKSRPSIRTSGSGSSSTSHKHKPLRTSEDSPRSAVEDKGRSFEQLIRSDQTIQYTLTPQNMRNIESPDSPRHAVPTTIFNINDVQRSPTSQSNSSGSRLAGVQLSPTNETAKSVKSAKSYKPIPRLASNAGARLRPNAPQARDARIDRDSMGDFAEFIRSTGPANVYEPTQPPRTAPAHRGANGAPRNVSSASVPRTAVSTASLPRRAESSAGKSRLQAREAVVPRGDSISDLIDFVRSGPQLEKENHRIPRTVAPFRSTMDSDEMSGAVGGKAIDASLPEPRYSQASTSVHSSVNSQSALLKNASKNKPLPVQTRGDFEEEHMMPKRKTRRVRDPYAIDFSDEEEEYLAAAGPRHKAVEEESLADFLKNVPPPVESTTTSVFDPVPRPNSSRNIKKKSSAPSLMSRFGRNGSVPQIPQKAKGSGHDSRVPPSKTSIPSYTPIAAKYSTAPTYEPTRGSSNSNYVSQLDSVRNKVVQRSYQPREAVYSGSRTNDLAEFLLKSEPPSSMQTQPQTFSPALQKEEASAFQRMFGRKKAR